MSSGHSSAIVAVALLLPVLTFAAEGAGAKKMPRIGWEEGFDGDISRWVKALKNPVHGTAVVSAEQEGGAINIVTQCGALNPNMARVAEEAGELLHQFRRSVQGRR